MATLKFTIVPSRQNLDGTHTIRLAVSHKHQTRYLTTRYRIDKVSEFKSGRVVARPDANDINRKLRTYIDKCETMIESLPVRNLTCMQLRDLLSDMTETGACTMKEYRVRKCNEMLTEGRESYVANYIRSTDALLSMVGGDAPFEILSPALIRKLDAAYRKEGLSDTTINLRMSNIKAFINSAVKDGIARFDIHPFAHYVMPEKNVRDIDMSLEEMRTLYSYRPASRVEEVARDMFFLSFFCAGINFTDLLDVKFPPKEGGDIVFIRKKSAHARKGEKRVSFTIHPLAFDIVQKYRDSSGFLDLGYNYTNRDDLRRHIARYLRKMGNHLGFGKPLMYYSARKTFCQIGFDNGIPLYILEYCIGHSIKDEKNRPIFDYLRIMKKHADDAINKIVSVVFPNEEKGNQ